MEYNALCDPCPPGSLGVRINPQPSSTGAEGELLTFSAAARRSPFQSDFLDAVDSVWIRCRFVLDSIWCRAYCSNISIYD